MNRGVKMSKDWTGNKNSVFKPLAASNHALYSEREPNDYYATEPKAIDCLLEGGAELHNDIWEPACGEGHLSEMKKTTLFTFRRFKQDYILIAMTILT